MKRKIVLSFVTLLVSFIAMLALIGCSGASNEPKPTDGLKYTVLSDGTLSVSIGEATDVKEIVIPEKHKGKKVTKIGKQGFSIEKSVITSVIIPNTVSEIEDGAFANCGELTSITLSNTLTTVGNSAFYNCYSLTSLDFPASLKSLPYGALINCDSLETISLPASALESNIRFSDLFKYKHGNSETTVPRSLKKITVCGGTEIRNNMFRDCENIKEVVICDTVTTIGNSAFESCSSLKSVEFSANLTKIGIRAFYNCDALTSPAFPDSLSEVGESAFEGCTSIREVELPSALVKLPDKMFYNCATLSSVSLPNTLTHIGSMTFSRTGIRSITIPQSVKSIGTAAFFANVDTQTDIFFENPNGWKWGSGTRSENIPSATLSDSKKAARFIVREHPDYYLFR